MSEKLDQLQKHALEKPEEYWAAAAEAIDWYKPADKILDDSGAPHFYRWFKGASCNTCYNAVDRHVEAGFGEQTAIIYDSPITGTQSKISYARLQSKVARAASVLKSLGVEKGDRVVIYMPMIPQAAIAMLACARIGAIHSVVFGGFAAHELATRLRDATPKVILTASCGIEPGRVVEYQPMIEGALAEAPGIVKNVVVFQRDQATWNMKEGRDLDWHDSIHNAEPADCVPVEATDPLYILYTSGTTGQPKGVVRDNGGHMVALKWSMKNIYNVDPGEVYWAASDVGWVVGHSYIVYAPLLHRATTVMFEGKPVGTPDAGVFWRVIEEHNVTTLFTAPTAFRAIKKEDPNGDLVKKYNLSKFRSLFLAGERCDPDTLHWAQDILGVPVIDHWWQTETGWPMASNLLGVEQLPIKAGSPTRAVPGYDVHVLTPEGEVLAPGEMGSIATKLPMPPGCLPTLWNADQRYIDSYLSEYEGFYATGDAGYMDEDGYIYVMSRTDDIINVAGHRLSTGAMEETLSELDDVAECAVIGVADNLKGQLPLGFVVLKSGVDKANDDVVKEAVSQVRTQIGPVAAFKHCVVVQRLPKTRSGKILRATMRKIADSEDFKTPATIDDPAILDEIKVALQGIGYAQ
ncbi:propionyl-CoA synthetase [Curvivirga sp.]|uniref:propionyl-CoA synthetase n=1 Tax=Curvivirga sp. TaxID=2856848 RepID=UPI003B5CA5AA